MSTTSKGDLTRERILEAAVREARAVGLEGLSIGGLAKATAMSKSGLFAHFGSKEDLQIAVLGAARESFIEAVLRPALATPRGAPRLRALFEGWLDWEEGKVEPGGCPFLAAAHEFDDDEGPVREEVVRALSDLTAALERVGRTALEEGDVRPDVDVGQLTFEVYGIIVAFHLHHRLLRSPTSRERARAAFDGLLARNR
jgi:AcrR family transcriptional regulator